MSFAVLFAFVIPAILGGASPVTIALVGSSVIILVVLYLTHGFSLTTTVAVLGTLASLALTGLLSLLAVRGLELSGVTDDTSTFLAALGTVDMRGLLLAGILIGSLGVLDDVTVTQAATVREIADANPAYDWRRLYRAGVEPRSAIAEARALHLWHPSLAPPARDRRRDRPNRAYFRRWRVPAFCRNGLVKT